MNIENMEQEFPKMPQSMRDMIEKEVEKQVKVTPQRGYFSLKKAVVASLAATFVLGTTIFAGTKLYRMSSSPQGNYGMTTKIEKTDATENTEKIVTATARTDFLSIGLLRSLITIPFVVFPAPFHGIIIFHQIQSFISPRRSNACKIPSSSIWSVPMSASRFTSSRAFPIATLIPAYSII